MSFKEYLNESNAKKITIALNPKFALRKKEDTFAIVKDHGKDKDGVSVYTVKQSNGFFGVLAIKDNAVVGSNRDNITSKDDAVEMAEHFLSKGALGLKNWSLGSGIYSKVKD